MQAPFADPLLGLDVLNKALPMVNRESELQVIRYLLNAVANDLPTGARALTITGETGVGKSRLLAEMFAEARTLGFHVLEGRTFEAGNMFPCFPFSEALRPVLRSSSTEQLRSLVGLTPLATARAEASSENISQVGMPLVVALSRLFPELPGLLGITAMAPVETLTPEQEKFRFLDAVATFLERMALEQPVLLGIDNLQWADSTSLELTMYLTVRLHSSRVALVGVTRPAQTVSLGVINHAQKARSEQ